MYFNLESKLNSSNSSNGSKSITSNCTSCSYSIDCQVSKPRANRQIEDDGCFFMDLESEEDSSISIDDDIYWLDMSDYRYTDTLWDYEEDDDYLDADEDWYEDEISLDFMSDQEEEFYRNKYYYFKYMMPKYSNEIKGEIEND
jgi:hypothetical protein